jgi:hypothetical protein
MGDVTWQYACRPIALCGRGASPCMLLRIMRERHSWPSAKRDPWWCFSWSAVGIAGGSCDLQARGRRFGNRWLALPNFRPRTMCADAQSIRAEMQHLHACSAR